MKEDDKKGKMSFAELLDTLDEPEPFVFPYEDYNIVGDKTEIERMYKVVGYINLDIPDFLSTLSKETVNYVTTGRAEGQDCVVNALTGALSKLPIEIDDISKLLFNIWTLKNMPSTMNEMNSMIKLISALRADIDVVWGYAFDDSMEGHQARVSLIAASK